MEQLSPPGKSDGKAQHSNFRKFFVRGLAILLPSVLTIWLLLAAYQFVQSRIADPINQGVRTLIIDTTPWPEVSPEDIKDFKQSLKPGDQQNSQGWLRTETRRQKLYDWWQSYHYVLDLIGLILAVVLIYSVGLILGSIIGRRLYHRGEELINRLPLVRRVYPSMKQVTDFFFGDRDATMQFNRVVAVEYPRKGLWSVGLVTGDTMRDIQQRAGKDCLTVFIPSSPTPFTGYVITVPRSDTIDLSITIEDAMKFAVSGGVLIPPSQKIQAIAKQGDEAAGNR